MGLSLWLIVVLLNFMWRLIVAVARAISLVLFVYSAILWSARNNPVLYFLWSGWGIQTTFSISTDTAGSRVRIDGGGGIHPDARFEITPTRQGFEFRRCYPLPAVRAPKQGTPEYADWIKPFQKTYWEFLGFNHWHWPYQQINCTDSDPNVDRYYAYKGVNVTFGIPYWFVMALSSVLPLLWVRRRLIRRRQWSRLNQGLCTMCGYDLRASPERCPECGRAVPAGHTASPRTMVI